jgi:hypothetical protein
VELLVQQIQVQVVVENILLLVPQVQEVLEL